MRATRSSSRQHPTSVPDDFSSPLFFLLFFLSAWIGVLDCTLLVFREWRWSESLGRRSCNPISLYKPWMEFRTGPDLVVSCNKTGVITFLSDDRWDFFQGLLKEIGVKHGDYNQDHIAVDLRMNVGREQACKEINITARARDKSLCMQSCSDFGLDWASCRTMAVIGFLWQIGDCRIADRLFTIMFFWTCEIDCLTKQLGTLTHYVPQ